MDQWEACKELAKIVHDNDIETSSYIIQNFINYVESGETFVMSLAMAKRGWNDEQEEEID